MRAALLPLLLAGAALAGPRVPDAAVAARAKRRAALAEHLGKGYALVLGQPPTDVLHPRQEGHFLYLTGVSDHGASLLLAGKKARPLKFDPKSKTRFREVLFLRELGEGYARFHGLLHRPGPATAAALGVETTLPAPVRAKQLGELLVAVLPKRAKLHVPAYRGPDSALVREIRRIVEEALAKRRPDVVLIDLHDRLAAQRSVKDEYEIGQLTRAIALTHRAFRAALAEIRPGSSEGAVDAALLGVVRRENAYPAYPFVVGAGDHAVVPHYFRNNGPLADGDVLVIDAGAAVERYAADITRTFPVNGRFTPRQREVYEVVLQAQRAAIEQVKPGRTFRQVHEAAKAVIARAGLAKFCLHATSHHVGLDVHDPGPTVLQPGMTFTVEPGVYIPEERIGVRIEDIVLVTDKGHRVLGEPFPKTADEIEALFAR